MSRRLLSLICLCGYSLSSCMPAASASAGATNTTTVGQELEYVKHEQDNISVEYRLLEGKVESLESALSLMREELADYQGSQRRIVADRIDAVHEGVKRMEGRHGSLLTDVRELKTHSNELAASFTQYKARVREFENTLDVHARNIANLEAAVSALTSLVKKTSASSSTQIAAHTVGNTKIYRIKSGDTLEKIARSHKTTVQWLKETNHLSNDLIRVGQEIQVPE